MFVLVNCTHNEDVSSDISQGGHIQNLFNVKHDRETREWKSDRICVTREHAY